MPDPQQTGGHPERHLRIRRIAIAIAAGGGLALGIAGLAQADDTAAAPSPSGSASAQAPGPGKGGPADHQHKPHLDGTVKSITDGRILIVDHEGFTRQINTSGGTPDAVKVGVRIHAEGTVNADGVSLDATTVGLAPAPPDGKNGPRGPEGRPGKGGPGQGGPGQGGPGQGGTPSAPPAPPESAAPPVPPSSAPAPSATS
jgi:hypothetical protein